jgi:hypothetical protein
MKKRGWYLGALALLLAATSSDGAVAGPGGSFSVACANGHHYPLRARAISPAGELVTGYLYTRPGRGVHVRLIPMGRGYRYAGRGIWLDGIREVAVLNFGKRHAVACTVQSVAGPAVVSALN